MSADHWHRVDDLFNAALERSREERGSFLATACGDPSTLAEVQGLLTAHESSDGFLETPMMQSAAERLAAHQRSEMSGRSIGHYEIVARLGAGGMGEVYRAWDAVLHRDVALKMLSGGPCLDRPSERLLAEARAAARLSHPNICTVHEVIDSPQVQCLVLEYVDGCTLAEQLSRRTPAASDALRNALQIAEGLHHAHDHGITHGDLKPGNVMVTPSGRLKLLDFGLARSIASRSDAADTTEGSASPCGTPAYAAPEVLEGAEPDIRSDVWSFGVVLHELLSGAKPFSAAIHMDQSRQTGQVQARALPAHVPAAAAAIVNRCLARDPRARYQSMRDVCADIEAALRVYGPIVGPAAPARTGRRIRLALAAAVGLLCSLCLGEHTPPPVRYGPANPTLRAQLAVLPFQVVDASPLDDYLGTGMADAISTRISSSSAIAVTPASAVARYGSDPRGFDAARIAAELGVAFLMIGVITPTEDGYVVSLTMKRASDGMVLWSDNRRVRRDELQSIEQGVAEQVITALKRVTAVRARTRAAHRDAQNAAAYDSYLRGTSALIRHDRQATEQAVGWFQSAVRADPQWASGYAGLALALARQPWYELGERASELQREAKDAATRAIELDPDSALAHQALASVYRYDEFEWDKVLDESAKAIALQPSLDLAYFNMASAFYHTGLVDLSEAAALAGVSLNPENRFECELNRGRAALYAGEYRTAEQRLQPIMKESSGGATWMLAEAKFYLHDAARSDALLRGLMKSQRMVVRVRAAASLAAFLAARQQRNEAEALIADIKSHDPRDHHVAYRLATAYAQLGRPGDAMFWLRRAANSGFPCETWFSRDELLAPVRGTQEYTDLAARLRTDAARRRARYAQVVALAAPPTERARLSDP